MATLKIDSILANIAGLREKVTGFDAKVARAGVLDGTYENGTNIAYVAAIQEYGDPSHNIPSRSFMRSTSKEKRDQWKIALRVGVKATQTGAATPENVLDEIGAMMAGDIQQKITEIQAPALSPITVMLRGMKQNNASLVVTGKTVGEAAQRVVEGKTNYGAPTKPLVDQGVLLHSISHDVESA